VLRQAILQFKYQNVKALAAPLAELMGEYLRVHSMHADTLVPVPLHPRRLRERGYNQSSLLAMELGRLTSWPKQKPRAQRNAGEMWPVPLAAWGDA
jgi:predicted amidophosphoribosyltransferase